MKEQNSIPDRRRRRDQHHAIDRAGSYGAGCTVCGRLCRSPKRYSIWRSLQPWSLVASVSIQASTQMSQI